ncbi:MAG: hypothetical protein LBH34_01375, partial [Prevotellaceae bacterium]|nr:hypothetical protein [Prevotellaceae bacterium]
VKITIGHQIVLHQLHKTIIRGCTREFFLQVFLYIMDVEVFETESAQMKSKIMVITSESEELILGERLGLLPRRKQEVCS